MEQGDAKQACEKALADRTRLLEANKNLEYENSRLRFYAAQLITGGELKRLTAKIRRMKSEHKIEMDQLRADKRSFQRRCSAMNIEHALFMRTFGQLEKGRFDDADGDDEHGPICAICHDQLAYCTGQMTPIRMSCTHIFHEACIRTSIDTSAEQCPVCRAPVKM